LYSSRTEYVIFAWWLPFPPFFGTILCVKYWPALGPVKKCGKSLKEQCHEIFCFRFSDSLHIEVNLNEKISLYVKSTNQRCTNKIIKTILIEDFFPLPPWAANIFENFQKNSKQPKWDSQGLVGNWFMQKSWSWKSHGIVPLIGFNGKILVSSTKFSAF
jgi:hypothetical protein